MFKTSFGKRVFVLKKKKKIVHDDDDGQHYSLFRTLITQQPPASTPPSPWRHDRSSAAFRLGKLWTNQSPSLTGYHNMSRDTRGTASSEPNTGPACARTRTFAPTQTFFCTGLGPPPSRASLVGVFATLQKKIGGVGGWVGGHATKHVFVHACGPLTPSLRALRTHERE